MQVRNKLFPYPVINYNKLYSNYNDYNFELVYELEETDKALVLKNAKFITDSSTLNTLISSGKVGVACIVECSNTVLRKSFDLSNQPVDIVLLKADYHEKVDISMFAYAKENFSLQSIEAEEDYRGLSFDIEKYDILGAYDGFNVHFKHEESEDNLVQSIFSINVNHDQEDGNYIAEFNLGRKISITLSENDYNNYKIIYTVPLYMEIFFNMILVPCLVEGMSLCKDLLNDSSKDLDDVGNQYLWFRSIINAYKLLNGTDLTADEFKSMSLTKLAQDLLGKSFGKSIKKMVEETNKLVTEE